MNGYFGCILIVCTNISDNVCSYTEAYVTRSLDANVNVTEPCRRQYGTQEHSSNVIRPSILVSRVICRTFTTCLENLSACNIVIWPLDEILNVIFGFNTINWTIKKVHLINGILWWTSFRSGRMHMKSYHCDTFLKTNQIWITCFWCINERNRAVWLLESRSMCAQ